MDESENETELLQTERAERLAVVDDIAIQPFLEYSSII